MTGRPNNARVRNNTAASASSDIIQVNRRLLKNIAPKPSWFFSKDWAGSIHGRTRCNTCRPSRLPKGRRPSKVSCSAGRWANCRGQRAASQQQPHNSGSAPTPNQCSPTTKNGFKCQLDVGEWVKKDESTEDWTIPIEEARTKQGSARLVEKLYEIKTGEPIRSVTLAILPQEWSKIPRRRIPDARYASQCQAALKRFADFVHRENGQATEIAHVTRPIVPR